MEQLWCHKKYDFGAWSLRKVDPMYKMSKEHPPDWLDLAISDFHLFVSLKKHVSSWHFKTNVEAQQAILKRLHRLGIDLFCARFYALVHQWNKCLTTLKIYMYQCFLDVYLFEFMYKVFLWEGLSYFLKHL